MSRVKAKPAESFRDKHQRNIRKNGIDEVSILAYVNGMTRDQALVVSRLMEDEQVYDNGIGGIVDLFIHYSMMAGYDVWKWG